MADKTTAMRLLEAKKIPYKAYTYSASNRDAIVIAELIGARPSEVFKTLVVVRRQGKPFLVMIPADKQLNLKKLAKIAGEKKLKMASHKDAEKLTGLQVGGISSLALIDMGFSIFLDQSAETLDQIYISAGKKGLQIKLSVLDLISVTAAGVAEVTD